MMLKRDENGALFVTWAVPLLSEPVSTGRMGHFKAWVEALEGENDFAGCGRYLCVARFETPDGQRRSPITTFPLYPDVRVEEPQLLKTFALQICAVMGYFLDEDEL